jgi:hypothetical protein
VSGWKSRREDPEEKAVGMPLRLESGRPGDELGRGFDSRLFLQNFMGDETPLVTDVGGSARSWRMKSEGVAALAWGLKLQRRLAVHARRGWALEGPPRWKRGSRRKPACRFDSCPLRQNYLKIA